MKYFIEYYHPDPEENPYYGVYNIWYKRYWWSWKTVLRKDLHLEGGLTSAIDNIIGPHLKSFNTCVAWSDVKPEPKEINL